MERQNRPTDIRIDQTKFNKAFAEADSEMSNYRKRKSNNRKNKSNNNNITFKKSYEDDDMDPFEPRQYTEDLGINIKNLFLTILEMMANGTNPIPYIMSNSKRQFYFAVMIISIGGLMLFLSNLMV